MAEITESTLYEIIGRKDVMLMVARAESTQALKQLAEALERVAALEAAADD